MGGRVAERRGCGRIDRWFDTLCWRKGKTGLEWGGQSLRENVKKVWPWDILDWFSSLGQEPVLLFYKVWPFLLENQQNLRRDLQHSHSERTWYFINRNWNNRHLNLILRSGLCFGRVRRRLNRSLPFRLLIPSLYLVQYMQSSNLDVKMVLCVLQRREKETVKGPVGVSLVWRFKNFEQTLRVLRYWQKFKVPYLELEQGHP